MATRSNRAATAANKKGGSPKRRNRTNASFDSHKSLRSRANQATFREHLSETRARRHNLSNAGPTERAAYGVPAGRGFTPGRKQRAIDWGDLKSRTFHLRCDALLNRNTLPDRYSGSGDNVSLPVRWNGVPEGTEELMLVCEDLDAPYDGAFVHWLVYRISVVAKGLPEGIPPKGRTDVALGALQGTNSFGRIGYTGPVPPAFDDWHHYRLRLFALESSLPELVPGMLLEEVFERMQGHVIGMAELVARYRGARPLKRAG